MGPLMVILAMDKCELKYNWKLAGCYLKTVAIYHVHVKRFPKLKTGFSS